MKKEHYKKAFVLIAAVLLVIADQLTKRAVQQSLRDTGKMATTVIPGLLELNYLENPAAAFGLFGEVIWLIVALTLLVALGLIAALFLYKQHSLFSYLAVGLLLAGGVGNLIDRIMQGYVVDFIHVMFFSYIFNVADCCVTIGSICLLVHYILCTQREKRRKADTEDVSV